MRSACAPRRLWAWNDSGVKSMEHSVEAAAGVVRERGEVRNKGRREFRSEVEPQDGIWANYGIVLALPLYCTGTAQMLHWYCAGVTLAHH